jgi:hypothetical protein
MLRCRSKRRRRRRHRAEAAEPHAQHDGILQGGPNMQEEVADQAEQPDLPLDEDLDLEAAAHEFLQEVEAAEAAEEAGLAMVEYGGEGAPDPLPDLFDWPQARQDVRAASQLVHAICEQQDPRSRAAGIHELDMAVEALRCEDPSAPDGEHIIDAALNLGMGGVDQFGRPSDGLQQGQSSASSSSEPQPPQLFHLSVATLERSVQEWQHGLKLTRKAIVRGNQLAEHDFAPRYLSLVEVVCDSQTEGHETESALHWFHIDTLPKDDADGCFHGRLVQLDDAGRIIYTLPQQRQKYSPDKLRVLIRCARVQMVKARAALRENMPLELIHLKLIYDSWLASQSAAAYPHPFVEPCHVCGYPMVERTQDEDARDVPKPEVEFGLCGLCNLHRHWRCVRAAWERPGAVSVDTPRDDTMGLEPVLYDSLLKCCKEEGSFDGLGDFLQPFAANLVLKEFMDDASKGLLLCPACISLLEVCSQLRPPAAEAEAAQL